MQSNPALHYVRAPLLSLRGLVALAGVAMTPIWRPLGAQLIPILVLEPCVSNDAVMCFKWFPGVLFCGLAAWRRITGCKAFLND